MTPRSDLRIVGSIIFFSYFLRKYIDSQNANCYNKNMRVITNRSITECWKKYSDAKPSLAVWEERIYNAKCKTHQDLKLIFPNADYIVNPHFKHLTVFNIKENEYRLAVDIFFNTGHLFVKWFGKHSDYNKIDFKMIFNNGFTLC